MARKGNTASRHQPLRLAAPTGGINAVAPGTDLPPQDCFYSYNTIATEQGVRARTGWREYATGLVGSVSNEVKTTIPFYGSTIANARLFQTTDLGIYDVSSGTATLVLTFATTNQNSGWGVAQAVTTTGGHFILYADEVNGLHYYSETTGAWAAYATGVGTGQIDGVDPAAIVSVTVWKNRVWLTQKDTATAWYLAAGAVFGTATAFNFGQRFAHGGSLVGLFNWSTDGGSGLDTLLVGISSGGDVVIYVGTDPASATTFGLKGVWFVGAVPAGRRIASDLGGDLMIISALGLVPLSRLILGDPDRLQYATAKVGPLFSRLANLGLNTRGWAMHTHPTDNALMLLVPTTPGENTTQLVMALGARSWSQYRDLPILSAAVWEGELFFGTADGRCCRNVGHVDGVTLADPDTGDAIDWSLLTRYQGSMSQKQVHGIRPILLSEEGAPAVTVAARYNFDQTEPDAPDASAGSDGSWDYGLVYGELVGDYFAPQGTLTITVTSEASFPATGGGHSVDITGGNFERLEYDSFTDPDMDLTDPTSLDHFGGETVTLVSPPDDDTGTWDTALWGGGGTPYTPMFGAVGMGRDIAIAVRGSAYSRTTLVGLDIVFETGGDL